mmetsp:Transcript_10722/g.25556  ORF Transcript_10722/g.25556 Transcript_10722/m.25556 type:complete len:417 (+) Transcript_10722:131-1381(+)
MRSVAVFAAVGAAIPRPMLSRSATVDVPKTGSVSFVHLSWGADESAEQHCAKVCKLIRAGGTVNYDNGTSTPLAPWGEDCQCDEGTPAQPVMKHAVFASDHSEEPQQGGWGSSSKGGGGDFEESRERRSNDGSRARETDQSAGGSSSRSGNSSQFEDQETEGGSSRSSGSSSKFEEERPARVRESSAEEERTDAEVTDRRSCKPVCTWACETPVCEQECRPKCEKAPECVTTCPPLDPATCTQECEYESDCRVECPPDNEKLCPNKNGCVPCETKCYKQPKCKVKCPDIPCKTECAKPKCGWKCNKPKSCPTPKCRMICEDAPKACNEETPTLPPPKEGHTVVSRSKAKIPPGKLESSEEKEGKKEARKQRKAEPVQEEKEPESNLEPIVFPKTMTTTPYGGIDQAFGQTTRPLES